MKTLLAFDHMRVSMAELEWAYETIRLFDEDSTEKIFKG